MITYKSDSARLHAADCCIMASTVLFRLYIESYIDGHLTKFGVILEGTDAGELAAFAINRGAHSVTRV